MHEHLDWFHWYLAVKTQLYVLHARQQSNSRSIACQHIGKTEGWIIKTAKWIFTCAKESKKMVKGEIAFGFKTSSYVGCPTNPILLSWFTRSINDKLPCVWIICGYCFNATNLKTITQNKSGKRAENYIKNHTKAWSSLLKDLTTFTYITSMPQLSHCKATLDQIIFSVPQPLVMVVLCTEKLDGTTPANIYDSIALSFKFLLFYFKHVG